MKETVYSKIIRKTGKKPIECKCSLCKSQCKRQCLGTPDDIKNIIEAGYGNRIMAINWDGAKQMGIYDKTIPIFTPLYDREKQSCTFFTNGLCELHDLGLKPTEGKLSHHKYYVGGDKFIAKKSIAWNVAKEWIK